MINLPRNVLIKHAPDRLSGLIDGIYAISMTILVLSIAVPSANVITTNYQMTTYIIESLGPSILMYFISFFLIANFWSNSNLLLIIEEIDNTVYYINLVALAFICLIPFATEFLAKFWTFFEADIIFASLIFIVSLLYLYMFIHSFKKDIIMKNFRVQMKPYMRTLMFIILYPVIASGLAIILSFYSPVLSISSYLLVLILRLIWKIFKHMDINPADENHIKALEKEVEEGNN